MPHQVVGPAGTPPGAPAGHSAVKRLGHLASVTHVAVVQLLEELGGLAVVLVEAQPVQDDAVGPSAIDLLEGDPPFGAMHQVVGMPQARQRGRSADQDSGRKRSASTKVL